MAQSQYPNSGILFPNNKKKGAKEPDFRGEAEIDGEPYEIAAWKKKGQSTNFLSLSFKPKEAGTARRRGESHRPPDDDGFDEF
jgi:uncharacterized protein (DUF736 family)